MLQEPDTVEPQPGKRQAPDLLFEDDFIRVEASLFKSDRVVISFSTYAEPGEVPERFGDRFLGRNGISAIYFTARRNHWWQVPALEKLSGELAKLTAGYRHRITYGSSMGGYGALLWAADLNVNKAVVVAPQTIITRPDRYPLSPGWLACIAETTIIRDDVMDTLGQIPEVGIVYDPFMKIDAKHVGYLSNTPNLVHFKLPHASHKLLRFLKETGTLSAALAGILNDEVDPAQLRQLVKKTRLLSPTYVSRIALAGQKKHPAWIDRIKAEHKARRSTKVAAR